MKYGNKNQKFFSFISSIQLTFTGFSPKKNKEAYFSWKGCIFSK